MYILEQACTFVYSVHGYSVWQLTLVYLSWFMLIWQLTNIEHEEKLFFWAFVWFIAFEIGGHWKNLWWFFKPTSIAQLAKFADRSHPPFTLKIASICGCQAVRSVTRLLVTTRCLRESKSKSVNHRLNETRVLELRTSFILFRHDWFEGCDVFRQQSFGPTGWGSVPGVSYG